MSSNNLDAAELYKFILADFKTAWEAMAESDKPLGGGGGFMFARQGMNLLESCARLADGPAREDLVIALDDIDTKYFTSVPSRKRPKPKDFKLPGTSSASSNLLDYLYDLIKHGQAHQYQQMYAIVSDGEFGISISGVDKGFDLHMALSSRRLHLAYRIKAGLLQVHFRPEVFISDLERAVDGTRLFDRGLTFKYLERASHDAYNFSVAALAKSLESAGHEHLPVVEQPGHTFSTSLEQLSYGGDDYRGTPSVMHLPGTVDPRRLGLGGPKRST